MEDIQEKLKEKEDLPPAIEEENESGPVVLMERDIEIFRLIHEHRYLVLNQIKRAFWKDCSDIANAAHKRVTHLVKAGYLEEGYSSRKGLILYLLSEKSYQELQRRNMDLGLFRYKLTGQFERHVDHDLKVGNIRLLFREMGLKDWTPERVLKERHHEERKVPDGILKVDGHPMVIEFENALKTKARYKEFFDAYRANGDYFVVIMIVFEGIKEWLIGLDYNPEQVWFVDYNNLMNQREKALLENKQESHELAVLLK